MRLLFDTHALLWWLADSPRLGRRARRAIEDPGHRVHVSAVTAWEITVKRALGKLEIPDDWAEAVSPDAFPRLDFRWEHALEVSELPDLHRDPFDRLLVAQARCEGMTLVTHDERLASYDVSVLWD